MLQTLQAEYQEKMNEMEKKMYQEKEEMRNKFEEEV